jgi:hypothetical protein
MYNFKLYEDFCDAAKELDIELQSKDGGCIYLVLPDQLNSRYWAMLWTPLNKLNQMDNKDTWQRKLDHLQYNHEDFHLEFDTKQYEHGSYWMFPEVNSKPRKDITKQDIKDCIERMLDVDNFECNVTWAKLQEPEDD